MTLISVTRQVEISTTGILSTATVDLQEICSSRGSWGGLKTHTQGIGLWGLGSPNLQYLSDSISLSDTSNK